MLYILCMPTEAVSAAGNGLMLWYKQVLPALLPFSILSNILIYSNYLRYITKFLTPILRIFLPISEHGAFVVISGFLFGFPMGSKNCAELLHTGALTKEEANILFVMTNNISPVFISSYILQQQLQLQNLTLLSFVILFFPPLFWGSMELRKKRTDNLSKKRPASESKINFKIIDAGIMNGFETLTRLGGYIMLFSMTASMLQHLPLPATCSLCITGFTEITTGIRLLSTAALSKKLCYVLAMTFIAFGGISGIAQTSSMIKDTPLSLKYYICKKIQLSVISGCLAWCVAGLLHL